MSGRVSALHAVLATGAPADARASDGRTPLHWAALIGHADAAEVLLAAGAHTDAVDNGGATPLVCAAWNAHAAVVSVLIAAEAALEARTEHRRWRALHHAASAGYPGAECVRALLAAGASADAVGDGGMSVLRTAVCALAPSTLQALLAALPAGAAAADVDELGETLLHAWARAALAQCVASLGHNVRDVSETAEVLIAAGVSQSVPRDMGAVAPSVGSVSMAGGAAAGTGAVHTHPDGGRHPVVAFVERAVWRTPGEYLRTALDAAAPPMPLSVASAVQKLVDAIMS